jgi:hypothetical protein
MAAGVGRLGNKLGDFVREMVRPAAVCLFREWGIDLYAIHGNTVSRRDGDTIYVDYCW